MKMFMYSLEADAHKWYQSLPPASISSLEQFHAAFNMHCQKLYSSKLIFHSYCEEYKDCVQDIVDSYEGCENEEDSLDEESIFSLPFSSASDENCVCCLSKESVEIASVLEGDILCIHVSKNPRYEQPTFDSYDDDEIFLPGLDLERKPVFSNEEKFSLFGQKIPLMIQVDIGGHPPFATGSKQLSGNFGNLLFLAGFNFRGLFEGLNEGFSRSRFSMITKGMIDPPK
jgi:hypothetical protein